jgi:hypothetical protein
MSTTGIAFTRKVLRPALGTTVGRRKSIAIGFDKMDFARISRLAQANEVAFQEQVRRLCKQALHPRTPQESGQ